MAMAIWLPAAVGLSIYLKTGFAGPIIRLCSVTVLPAENICTTPPIAPPLDSPSDEQTDASRRQQSFFHHRECNGHMVKSAAPSRFGVSHFDCHARMLDLG